ncbi:hypothetical protein B0H19DRAFT_1079509 [Mycena capillaripes]|nr:hypothetical protein B0H19DRAFT_1079509 [Mycena capillaripes]
MSSQPTPLRRSTRQIPIKPPTQSLSLSPPVAGASRVPAQQPTSTHADICELHAVAKRLTKHSVGSPEWEPFLAKLQEVLEHHQPGVFEVFSSPITWIDKDDYDKVARWLPDATFVGGSTLRRWIDTDASHGRKFSLAVMTTPPSYLVGKETRQQWAARDHHIWVLLTAHAPPGSKGKTIITYDTDVEERHNQAREREALGAEYRYVQYIRRRNPSRANDRVWQNFPVPDGQPSQGFCFHYTMEWLLGLAENGLEGRHANGTLAYLEGFCQIKA